ncbi:MAG TPA: hypothetical protein PKN54_02275 [Candidatus Cloacimonas acidaminovorans]|nr:hypothetical protein [Candidatus Cloacimonas acidaminovorans]
MSDVGLGFPGLMQPNKPKRLTLQELQEERKRLTEITKIQQLRAKQRESDLKVKAIYDKERQERINALNNVGGEAIKIVKASHSKISDFKKSRIRGKPLIQSPFKKKSIYD